MSEQTALTELLQWVRSTLPMDLDTPRLIEEKIESLLPKEKEQLNLARLDGINLQIKDMENKQTAVEWLEMQYHRKDYTLSSNDFQQAKQMEKEQLDNSRPQIISNCVIKEMSNEEVWNASIEYDNHTIQETPMVNFQQGAFWYREQLKKA